MQASTPILTSWSFPMRVGRRVAMPGLLTLAFSILLTGCAGPRVLPAGERMPIDHKLVETPSGFEIEPYAVGLNGPVAFTFDDDGNLLIAEGGLDDSEPKIYGFTPNGVKFDIYPIDKPVLPFTPRKFRLYGPIGSILFQKGTLYVSHRDKNDFGIISALDYKGGHKTVVAELPAQGEYGVTDLAIDPRTGRLFFGIGSATNSGVVGEDDWDIGWVKRHPNVHEIPYTPEKEVKLTGVRFDSRDPRSLFLAPEKTATAYGQPFGASTQTRIKGATANNPKCNSAILSCQPDGGDLRVEVQGVRLPRGLAFNEYGTLYFTNQGMECRGSRPVKDDPDSFLRGTSGNHHGFPDATTNLISVTEPQFQPPPPLILPHGYPENAPLINQQASGISLPNPRDVVYSTFPSQSGAWGFDFVPSTGPFRDYAGSAIVALFGDRAPFATSGQKLNGRQGFKLVRVEVDRAQTRDFVKNVKAGPASDHAGDLRELERPIDIKFGPDGALYILDFGQMRMKNGEYDVTAETGRVYRVLPTRAGSQGAP